MIDKKLLVTGLAFLAAGVWTPGNAQSADSAVAPAAPTAPAATSYVLAEVAGKPLPVQIEKGLRCREDVTAGSLTLGGDGRWLLETDTREVCGDRTKPDRDTDDGTYRTEGGTIRFFDDDGHRNGDRGLDFDREIELDDFETGVVAADGTLTVQLTGGKTTLVFRPAGG